MRPIIKNLLICLLFPFLPAGHSLAEPAAFHHVRLQVQDPAASVRFYQDIFGAVPVLYNGQPALQTEGSRILFNLVDAKPVSNLLTTISHIGWSGVDGPAEFGWLQDQGVDFYQPLTPLGRDHYMYLFGPDGEVVEIYTGNRNHTFEHIHLLATDPGRMMDWLETVLQPETPARRQFVGSMLLIRGINIMVMPNRAPFRPPEQGEVMVPTETSTIHHLGFSVTDLDQARADLLVRGITTVSPTAVDESAGHRSFFIRGPDGLLLEMLEDEPLPWPPPEPLLYPKEERL